MRKWLAAEVSDDGKTLYLSCHLDTTKMIDGAPDPHYVRDYRWGLSATMTKERAIAETKLLLAQEVEVAKKAKLPITGAEF